MKTKKRIYVVLLASLLVSLCLLCFSGFRLIAHAEEVSTSTVDSTISEQPSLEEQDSTTPKMVGLADEINNKITAYLGTIFGASGTLLDLVLLLVLSRKKDEKVSVVVDDSETQEKLKQLQTENMNMKQLMLDMFQIQKGTFEVLKTVFADNTNLDEKTRKVIKQLSTHEEDVVKDVQDIFSSETYKQTQTTLKNISNIILG